MISLQRFFNFAGLKISNVDLEEATNELCSFALSGEQGLVVTPNADHIVNMQSNAHLRHAYKIARFTYADGMPLVWASKLMGYPLKTRVTGADLLPALCAKASIQGLRVFFFGAPPGVAALAQANLQKRYPGLIAENFCPPWGFEHNPALNQQALEAINQFSPHILFVGLGSPKQEKWASENMPLIKANLVMGVGAAIDFAAGSVKRAPAWMQRLGLEWMFRALQEPRRLIPRYLNDFRFFAILAREFYRKSFG